MAALKELYGNYRDSEGFERAVADRRRGLEEADLPVTLDPEADPAGDTEHRHGELLLTLYFHQLFSDGPTILDMRRERFAAHDGEFTWSPAHIYIDWDPHFREGVRAMYRGFYTDDEAQFEQGLAALSLHGMGDLFRQHFGEGDQTAVTFDIDHFHGTFGDILARCDEQDRSLHHNFAALGAYLATLYDHLSALGGEFDVRAAFERATD
jgi:hypothetical protein